jgi:hypothetical protein
VNGELAEVICLATHGTNWLANEAPMPSAFERVNSTFQFVGSTQFVLAKSGRLGRSEQASTVGEWIANSRAAKASRIWLVIPGIPSGADQHSLAAFANAGQWGLAVQARKGTQVWRATWTVADRDAPDRRIWAVRYDGTRVSSFAPQRPDLRQAQDQLVRALGAIRDFAEGQPELGTWVDWFSRALGGDEIAYHSDMLPDQLAGDARQLIAMASRAWVFGGMGSWNDIWIDGDAERYQRLTRGLYDAVLTAFLAGVNSTG